jgi:hypothetical protein
VVEKALAAAPWIAFAVVGVEMDRPPGPLVWKGKSTR